jgi:hypothetical protein
MTRSHRQAGYLHRRPFSASRRSNASGVQLSGDTVPTRDARTPDVVNNGEALDGTSFCATSANLKGPGASTLRMSFDPEGPTPAPEGDSALARGGKRNLRSVGDHLPLLFRHGGHDVKCEAVGRWHVHSDKIGSLLHKPRYEGDAPGKAIQLGDHQRRAPQATLPECRIERRAVCTGPAFDLLELGDQPVLADEPLHSLTLRFQPQSRLALLAGAASEICDVSLHHP